MEKVKGILKIADSGDAEAAAALSNITNVVKMLHDPKSRFLESLLMALSDGKLCIVDMSMYGSDAALILSGIVLNRIFEHNQREFTKADSKTIPTIAVLEEAQSVLTPGKNATAPFISWVKEGRKYDLGALMITQQPGSISTDILSQGDNWFVFHLLSDKDLQDVRRANAHFSNDLLSSLLNEPIVGQGVFWSSVDSGRGGSKPYPIPIRVFSFEHTVRIRDKVREIGPVCNYASSLRDRLRCQLEGRTGDCEEIGLDSGEFISSPTSDDQYAEKIAIEFSNDKDLMDNFDRGIPWGAIKGRILGFLPENLFEREDRAYHMVRVVVERMFGEENQGWVKQYRMTNDGRRMLFVARLYEEE